MTWLLHNAPVLLIPAAFGLAWVMSRKRAAKPYDPCSDNECLKGRK